MEHQFFRIVRNETPTAEDFQSARAMGVPRPETNVDEWDRGISVYDNFDYALRRAERNRSGLGRFVATLAVPSNGGVRFAKTFGRHHYTIYGDAESLLALVRGPAIPAPAPNGDQGNGRLL